MEVYSYVCQVSVVPTRASRPIVGLSECSLLAADTTDLTSKCDSIFQWLSIYGYVRCLKLGLLWHHACSQSGLHRLLHKIHVSGRQGGNYLSRIPRMKYSNVNFVSQTYAALRVVPSLLLFLGRSGRCFFCNITRSNILQVVLFLVGVQFFGSMHFC